MTAPYKKRAKAGYNNDKEISNRSERTYEVKDIQSHLEETSKIKPLSKKKEPKVDKDLLSHISNLKWALKSASGKELKYLIVRNEDGYFAHHYQSLYQRARVAIPILRAKLLENDLTNKVKKQVKELLDQVPNE